MLPLCQRIVKVELTSTQFVRKTPGATSGRKLKDSQTNKVHTSSREITSEPYMSSNYKNSVKTTTTDLLNNKLWCLWCPDEHLRCWIEKIKNLREKNFEGEATTSFWMKRIEYLNSKYVGLTLVLNILILQFFFTMFNNWKVRFDIAIRSSIKRSRSKWVVFICLAKSNMTSGMQFIPE